MIKEKLMEAVKSAAADYNGGMGANDAVAKAASAADFNGNQTDRLVEMFNTLAAISKERDKNDPTGACELASKEAVAKILLDGASDGGLKKAASSETGNVCDYSFYANPPSKTNATMEAMDAGFSSAVKEASSREDDDGTSGMSSASVLKMIFGDIDLLKSAGEMAGSLSREMDIAARERAVKIAEAIEMSKDPETTAAMFKSACTAGKALSLVSSVCGSVASSDGGAFASSAVFDASPVEDLLKMAEEVDTILGMASEFRGKEAFYIKKAEEAESSVTGLPDDNAGGSSLSDFFDPAEPVASGMDAPDGKPEGDVSGSSNGTGWDTIADSRLSDKLASVISEMADGSLTSDGTGTEIEKDAAPIANILPTVSFSPALKALSDNGKLSGEDEMLLNVRRSMLLDDLMANDPIIRDADPNVVAEVYKSIVMSSPRISLDKAMVRSVLRSAVNSVAVSPADMKVMTDVDKGIRMSNVEDLTRLDSSIKDSNYL